MRLEDRAVRQVREARKRNRGVARVEVFSTEDKHITKTDRRLDVVVRVAATRASNCVEMITV